MNILKKFRNKYYIVFVAMATLFYSCEVYEVRAEKKFNFEQFEIFKSENLNFINNNFEKINSGKHKSLSKQDMILENMNILLEEINQHFNTNVSIPNHILLGMHNNTSQEDVKTFLKKENLITDNDIVILEKFTSNSQNIGFDNAINEMEKDVIEKDLNELEFQHYNNVANSLKILDYENSETFSLSKNGTLSKSTSGPWWCLLSMVLWVFSLIAFVAACAGPQALIFCIGATANLLRATVTVVIDCTT